MFLYSWVGSVDFTETDPHVFAGRVEVFGPSSSQAIDELHIRYKQPFPNDMDFRDWIDDFTSEEQLGVETIFQNFSKAWPEVEIWQLGWSNEQANTNK